MLHLLNPLGLVALTALLVPAAIHLWRFPQRTVRLGSLKFLDAVARPRLNQWRWRERMLLLLRLLLVALLALLLAQPEWRRSPSSPVRWMLIAPEVKLSGLVKTQVDDLTAQGYERKVLASDDVWSALREVDARVAKGSDVVVIAPRTLAALRGERPALAHTTVRWLDSSGQTAVRWIDSATRNVDGKELRLMVGASDATSTRFEHLTMTPETKRVTIAGGELDVPKEIAQAPAVRVAIFSAEDRTEDVRVVTAAVQAVAAVSGRAITVSVNPPASALAEMDWAFVLGAVTPDEVTLRAAVERGLQLVRDAGAAAGVERTATFTLNSMDRVSLWRRGPAGPGVVLARDSFGEAMLTREKVGRGQLFQFSSRFNPAWTDWTQSTAFPAWMRSLLLAERSDEIDSGHDQRVIGAEQAEPRVGTEGVVIPEAIQLAAACWWLVVGLFVIERLLSHFWARRAQEGAA